MLNEKNEFVVVKLTNKHKLTDNEQKNELISLLTKNELKNELKNDELTNNELISLLTKNELKNELKNDELTEITQNIIDDVDTNEDDNYIVKQFENCDEFTKSVQFLNDKSNIKKYGKKRSIKVFKSKSNLTPKTRFNNFKSKEEVITKKSKTFKAKLI
jgi:hypothetical protein